MSNLLVVYRSCPGDGHKPRPAGWSKLRSLATFTTAVDVARSAGHRVSVLWVNDCTAGAIPRDALEAMDAVGGERRSVHLSDAGTNRRSYRAALTLAAEMSDDHDAVWLAEDDYLYRADALVEFLRAVARHPDVDYFSLFSPSDLIPDEPRTEGGWREGTSATSTFGLRGSALRRDLRLLRLLPLAGAAWDYTTSMVVTGRDPYPFGRLPWELKGLSGPRRAALRAVGQVARLVALGVPARSFLICDPIRAWHCEVDAPGSWTPWVQEAVADLGAVPARA